MKTKVKTIKRKLEQLQKQPKISQCEIARISGIHRSTLNLWLNGQATMRPAQISAVESAIRTLASRRLQSILKDLVPKATT